MSLKNRNAPCTHDIHRKISIQIRIRYITLGLLYFLLYLYYIIYISYGRKLTVAVNKVNKKIIMTCT